MDIRRFVDTAPKTFYQWGTLHAYPREPLPYIEVLDHVQGMTTPGIMHILNLGVQCMTPDEVYLEVGTWRGATFIGALLGNTAHGIAVDNDTMDEHDKDERLSSEVWRENVARFGLTDRATYVDGSVPAVWERHGLTNGRKVGVYLFDGDKSTEEAAYAGLAGIVPFLADQALIVIDDSNTFPIRHATHEFFRRYFRQAYPIIDMPTPQNCWPGFWNGITVLAWGLSREG